METVGARIKARRTALGLRRKAVAVAAGYQDADSLYKIETGNGVPKAETLAKIAAALDTTVEALLGTDGDGSGEATQSERKAPSMPPSTASEFAALLPDGAPARLHDMARLLWESAEEEKKNQ